ncbi:hypothetical protein PIIN_08810 [Serendipita indica DSM 11827]|uniref:Uncharacterized protein n=1 Tax=Serendipita indica (strain DSM 11827) TaxID=1109443 RepID=G4TU48_SERID|nr:hypothetical protein PIIN_08810 [Serendipita indica DSM 11827]
MRSSAGDGMGKTDELRPGAMYIARSYMNSALVLIWYIDCKTAHEFTYCITAVALGTVRPSRLCGTSPAGTLGIIYLVPYTFTSPIHSLSGEAAPLCLISSFYSPFPSFRVSSGALAQI